MSPRPVYTAFNSGMASGVTVHCASVTPLSLPPSVALLCPADYGSRKAPVTPYGIAGGWLGSTPGLVPRTTAITAPSAHVTESIVKIAMTRTRHGPLQKVPEIT